jgi:hypothetical protein
MKRKAPPSLTRLGGASISVLFVEDVKEELRQRGFPPGRKRLHGALLRDEAKRVILIDSSLSEREASSTFLHEVLHALLPDLSEDRILKLEKSLFPFLWNRGFRPVGPTS